MTIYVKYAVFNDTTKVLDWSAETSLDTLVFEEMKTVSKVNSVTLKGTRVSHRLFKSKKVHCVISADQLADPTKYAFTETMFTADCIMISTWATLATRWTGTDTTQKKYTIEADSMPVEFLEGSKNLPEVTFELLQKEAD